MIAHVYAIAEIDGQGPVKIGWTIEPEVRLRALQTGNPRRLEIIARRECADIATARAIEAAAHVIFASQRFIGEWFWISGQEIKQALLEIDPSVPEPGQAPLRDESLSKAIALAGGAAALARTLKITREAVSQWSRCPAIRAIAASNATGRRVTEQQLRPDIFLAGQAPLSEAAA